jgi:hypothetical protein
LRCCYVIREQSLAGNNKTTLERQFRSRCAGDCMNRRPRDSVVRGSRPGDTRRKDERHGRDQCWRISRIKFRQSSGVYWPVSWDTKDVRYFGPDHRQRVWRTF